MQKAGKRFWHTQQRLNAASTDPRVYAWKPEKLALVIPTFCEVANIRTLLNQVRAALEPLKLDYEILIVDDDSRDGIVETVAAIAREDTRIRLLVREGERGLSGAIMHGWRNADAPLLGVMDADLQHPPTLLPELLKAIAEGHDLAIGSRYVHGGKLGAWNPMRKLLSALAVWATRPLLSSDLCVKDPMSGFFLIRSRCIQRIDFQKSGFKLLLEILVHGCVGSVREIPFTFGRRLTGGSKASFKVGWDYALLLARLYYARYGVSRRLRSVPAD